MKTVLPLVVTVLASLCARRVLSLPTGAPVAACDTLTPNPIGHRGLTQNSTVPYAIDLDPFRTQADNESLQYTPGKTYTRKEVVLRMSCGRILAFISRLDHDKLQNATTPTDR